MIVYKENSSLDTCFFFHNKLGAISVKFVTTQKICGNIGTQKCHEHNM